VEKESTRTSRAGTSNRGFTFIELSLVLLVIGLILVFALPRLGDLGDTRLKEAARHLAGTLQSVFDSAVFQKKTFGVVYDLSSQTYQVMDLSQADGMTPVSLRSTALPGQVRFKDISTEAEERVTEGKTTTLFSPEGRAERTTIHLTDGRKDYTLVMMPFSGKVRILEGYVEIQEEQFP
jgi:type II secretion system protein H